MVTEKYSFALTISVATSVRYRVIYALIYSHKPPPHLHDTQLDSCGLYKIYYTIHLYNTHILSIIRLYKVYVLFKDRILK